MFSGMNYVYEVYKTQSFSKAAKRLYISQPSLSAMIKKIENKVGAPLFDRGTTPIRLTEYGEHYIRIAEKIMDLEDEFAYCTDNLNELKSGRLSIGTTMFFASFILPRYVSRFSAAYPHVSVNIHEDHSFFLEQKASNGDFDLVLDNYNPNKDIYTKQVLTTEQLLLAVPASFESNLRVTRCRLTFLDIVNDQHLLPSFPAAPLKMFEEDPFIALRPPNDTRKRMELIFQNAGVKFSPVLKLDQLLTAYHLTEHGMGATIVTDRMVTSLPPNPDVIYYKLDDPNCIRNINIYYRTSKYLTRSMKEFIRIAIEEEAKRKLET